MKTQFILMSTVAVLGASLVTTSYAAPPEYLHFTRHRDSNGNLLMEPTPHHSEPSVMQKTMIPAQPKAFERRSTDWGMSVQEVKENEPIQSSWELQSPVLADLVQRVAYHTEIEGVAAALTYTFYQNHLGQAKYVFESQYEDASEYVQDFHTIKGWISQSYGAPTSAQEIWLDTLYQYDKSLWGQALKRGHLVMVAEWTNPGTDIVLVLDGGEDAVGLVADFSSTTYVVPVSLDSQNSEQNIEEAVEKRTIQDDLYLEPAADAPVEDLAVQEMPVESEGRGEFHSEAEMASQGPASESEQIKEIEQMLNEQFPVNDPLNKEFPVIEPVNKEFPVNEAIESSMDIHMPETAMDMPGEMPVESSLEGTETEALSIDEHVDGQEAIDEHVPDHVMEAEAELDPQHL